MAYPPARRRRESAGNDRVRLRGKSGTRATKYAISEAPKGADEEMPGEAMNLLDGVGLRQRPSVLLKSRFVEGMRVSGRVPLGEFLAGFGSWLRRQHLT